MQLQPSTAYRHDLIRHIVPGLAGISAIHFAAIASEYINSARAARWHDFAIFAPARLLCAAVVLGLGLGIVLWAVRGIGLAAAGFVEEYESLPRPHRPVGAYIYIRHPIAVGGVIMAGGCTIAARTGGWVWLINVLMLIPYGPLEDRRLRRVFGTRNEEYLASVPRFVPLNSKPGTEPHVARRSTGDAARPGSPDGTAGADDRPGRR